MPAPPCARRLTSPTARAPKSRLRRPHSPPLPRGAPLWAPRDASQCAPLTRRAAPLPPCSLSRTGRRPTRHQRLQRCGGCWIGGPPRGAGPCCRGEPPRGALNQPRPKRAPDCTAQPQRRSRAAAKRARRAEATFVEAQPAAPVLAVLSTRAARCPRHFTAPRQHPAALLACMASRGAILRIRHFQPSCPALATPSDSRLATSLSVAFRAALGTRSMRAATHLPRQTLYSQIKCGSTWGARAQGEASCVA